MIFSSANRFFTSNLRAAMGSDSKQLCDWKAGDVATGPSRSRELETGAGLDKRP